MKEASPVATVGLRAACRHVPVVRSDRGLVFYLCTRAAVDPRFPKYPKLPVLSCAGYAPVPPEPEEKFKKGECLGQRGSAGDVQDGVGCSGVVLQFLDGLQSGQNDQFDFAALRLTFDFLHHRQSSGASADH
jgi:hypothetical protein